MSHCSALTTTVFPVSAPQLVLFVFMASVFYDSVLTGFAFSRFLVSLPFLQIQFIIFKPLSYCFEETIGFDVKASFTSRPVSRLIR